MLEAILGFMKALPELLKLVREIMDFINKVSGNDVAGFIAKTNQAFAALNAAKSQKEYEDAAKAIQDAIRRS